MEWIHYYFPVTGAVAMDGGATTIIYRNAFNSPDQARLFAYDIASGRQWVLYLTDIGCIPN